MFIGWYAVRLDEKFQQMVRTHTPKYGKYKREYHVVGLNNHARLKIQVLGAK